ncbi:MAG: prepilin-type N-terminal cleavage/methylation domain-containing protein [Planctomycetia bacterium]|nr:prepilin-type N-terminal cleavage/methylation domain-containing protein [Planctomycetia bacterium]
MRSLSKMSTLNPNRRTGFTLIEILIVVVIMAILAGMIIPQFTETTKDAKVSTALFNLNTMRAQIELFKAEHGGTLPNATLSDLTIAKAYQGKTYGPYMSAVLENSLTGSRVVKNSAAAKVVAGDITAGNGGGWVYSPSSGEIRLDTVDYWQK